MQAKIKKFVSKHWPPALLILITTILAFLNYQPHTWLTGWDNLHPEFNFPLNLSRSLNAAWQEYQSLGLLGGMAHSADLIRTLTLYLLSFIFPTSLLRYLYTFAMLILGPLGTYFLTKKTLLSSFKPQVQKIASLFAALFYLLNLATLQIFYIPFEAFITFHAALPWLLLSSLHYLKEPDKKSFLLLTLTFILSTPAFYIQTLFLVFTLVLTPFLIHHLLKNISFSSLVSIFSLTLTLIITQSYWLLPNAYFTLTSSNTTIVASQNQIATREIFARNQDYGQIQDIALLKGFNFNYTDLNLQQNQFQLLMGPWNDHLNQPSIQIIGYTFFALTLIGLIYSLLKKTPFISQPTTSSASGAQTPWDVSPANYPSGAIFLTTLILSLFFLINLNPPSQKLYQLFQNTFPTLSQAFRSPFTKLATPAALSFSAFLSLGIALVFKLFSHLHKSLAPFLTSFSFALLLILFSSPAFQGYFIDPNMRQPIPPAYLELFDYLDKQDHNTRLANFPQHTLWGWRFYSWGYRGSGFLWYGIPQPVLDRAFDVWSPYSQNYYQEIKTALYSQNLPYLEHLLEKYQINWLLVDNSVIIPASKDQTPLYTKQLKTMLKNSSLVQTKKTFDHLTLYKTQLPTQPQNFFNSSVASSDVKTPWDVSTANYPSGATPATLIQTPQNNNSTLEKQTPQSASGGKNCDPFNSTHFNRQVQPKKITYTATRANSCDHFTYPSLPHSYGYQFNITHQNTTGFPFLVCLESYTSKNCLTYQYLSKSSQWHTDTLTIPPMNPTEYGYTLHFYNYSLNHTPTQNSLKKIKIEPLPVSQFNFSTPPSSHPYTTLTSTKKHTYSLYTASTNSPSHPSLLTLNQAFNKGWKAYLIDSDTLNLPTWQLYLKSTMLEPLPTHQKNNQWANSWLLPQGKSSLLIIFYPQLLQYLGFALLLLIPPLYLFHKSST